MRKKFACSFAWEEIHVCFCGLGAQKESLQRGKTHSPPPQRIIWSTLYCCHIGCREFTFLLSDCRLLPKSPTVYLPNMGSLVLWGSPCATSTPSGMLSYLTNGCSWCRSFWDWRDGLLPDVCRLRLYGTTSASLASGLPTRRSESPVCHQPLDLPWIVRAIPSRPTRHPGQRMSYLW